MTKRLIIRAYDALSAFVLAFVAACVPAQAAFAYIDPSVMTYTIQAVAGVAVALSTVLGVALRRGRKTLLRVLDIDENAKREVERPVHRVAADGSIVFDLEEPGGARPEAISGEAAQAGQGVEASGGGGSAEKGAREPGGEGVLEGEVPVLEEGPADEPAPESQPGRECAPGPAPEPEPGPAPAPEPGPAPAPEPMPAPTPTPTPTPAPKRKRKRVSRRPPYRPKWKERLAYGFIVGFFFAFTIYFAAPLEIVNGASGDLVFSMGDVWWVLVLPGLGMAAGIALALSIFRGRAYAVALMLVGAVGLCAYVQALFLNFGLPAADGNSIAWGDYMLQQVVSSIVWAIIVAGAVVAGLLYAKRARGVAVIVALFLVAVQGVGLVVLATQAALDADSDASAGGKVLMTEDQLFTVNPDHNVVVFVLDTYDTAYLRRVLDMDPQLLDGLTGFTNYENATSAMIPTRFAIPEMLTGQMPSFDEPFSTYKDERYARSTYLQSIYDAGYSIGLYTDSLRISTLPKAEQADVTGKTVNMHDMPDSAMDVGATLYSLYQMGQYRDVLWPFKWAFWYYTDQINQSMVASGDDAAPNESIYVMDDIRYYNRLCSFGLSLEEGQHAGAFRFIHLLGSHYPFTYDENVNDLGEDNSDVFKQSRGAIKIVTEYIDQLKELGVYENTTLIITADHGYWTITLDPIEETSTPIMFVKPEQSAQDAAKPIVVDEKPVSHLDLQATVLDAMGLDWSEYANRDEWAGYSMFGPIDESRVRHYLTTDSEPDLTEVQFREYRIDGNALDWESWSETGRTIDAQE